MKRTARTIILLILVAGLVSLQMANPVLADYPNPFTFAVTADMRNVSGDESYNNSNYFREAMEAIDAVGGSAFMLSPNDIDPVDDVKWTIELVMGTEYIWYPVVGNHELPGAGYESYYGGNMDLLSSCDYDQNGVGIPPVIVNTAPSGCPQSTYSFDYENAHFVVLNEYCDTGGDTVTSGDVPDHLYNWLVDDLQATTQDYIFVFGHEPAFPQPDADNGRLRHNTNSLSQYPSNRTRFWNLLRGMGVVAYFCGHTHNYSAYYYDGIWQLDAGHARGEGDTEAASTFLLIHVEENTVTFDAYRDGHDGVYDYDDILHSGTLSPLPVFIHFQDGVSPDTGYSGTLDTVLSNVAINGNLGAYAWDGNPWADYSAFMSPITSDVKANLRSIMTDGESKGRVLGRMGQIGDSITNASPYFRNAILVGSSGNETNHDYISKASWRASSSDGRFFAA